MISAVQTVSPDDHLDRVIELMTGGNFRHLPVVEEDRLVGIVSLADTREHVGHLERSKVSGAMTEDPATIDPETPVAEAAERMVRDKIGALPVVEEGRLIGIVTASDLLRAFVDLERDVGEGVRIDLRLDAAGSDLEEASAVIRAAGGRVLGVGGDVEHGRGDAVVCMHVETEDPNRIADELRTKGFGVVAVHH